MVDFWIRLLRTDILFSLDSEIYKPDESSNLRLERGLRQYLVSRGSDICNVGVCQPQPVPAGRLPNAPAIVLMKQGNIDPFFYSFGEWLFRGCEKDEISHRFQLALVSKNLKRLKFVFEQHSVRRDTSGHEGPIIVQNGIGSLISGI
jgi:hypothetical protein